MPYDFNDPNQQLFPGDLWTRGDLGNPNFESSPIGFGPPFPRPPERSAGYSGGSAGYTNPVLQAAFMGGPGPQSNDGTAPFDPTAADRNAPFSLAPDFSTPTERMRSLNLGNDGLENPAAIVQAGFPRGRGITLPGPGPITPAPSGPFDWQNQTEQAIMRLWNFLQRRGSGFGQGAGGGRNGEGCKEEWDDAREVCLRELSKPYPNRRVTGGHLDLEDCARGHVSERCGGNLTDK